MVRSATLLPFRIARNAWRNSPWVVIAVTSHVILGATISIVTWRADDGPLADPSIEIARTRTAPAAPEIPVEEPLVQRTPLPIDEVRELVTIEDSAIEYVPSNVRELTQPIGDPTADRPASDFGPSSSSNIGVGNHPGQRGYTSTFSPRGYRGEPGKGGGPVAPPEATERAVLFGLRWLVRHQQPNGSWSIARLDEVCADASCRLDGASFTAHYDEGLTGLALLAFLGAGHSHESQFLLVDDVKGVQHKLGHVVKEGLRWLAARQKDDGSFGELRPFLYNESLCAMALCEAYWLSGARTWKTSAQRAVDFLVRAQKRSPRGDGFWGWRYGPREDVTTTHPDGDEAVAAAVFESDLSVTTWAVMALKSAELAGLDVPAESLTGALEFVRWVSLADGRAGYLSPDGAGLAIGGFNDHFTYHTASMSALAMCSRTFLAHDAGDPFLEAGARVLVRDLPDVGRDRLGIDYYYWYYGSLALNQFDGPASPRRGEKYWGPWQRAMADALVGLQEDGRARCSHGAWLLPDRWSHAGGPLYATALNVLTLEVYYRYPNAFGAREVRAASAPGRR